MVCCGSLAATPARRPSPCLNTRARRALPAPQVVKSKLQTQNPWAADRYRGILDCTRRLYASEGWRGLWRGFTPCALRSVPANAVTFIVYERAKSMLEQIGV